MWLRSVCTVVQLVCCSVYAKEVVRNPFACTHKHGSFAINHQLDSARPSSLKATSDPSYVKASEGRQTSSSGWRVIEQRGSKLIMQHTDGSIREISLGR